LLIIILLNNIYKHNILFNFVLPRGVQRENELDEFIAYIKNLPVLNEELSAVIERDKKELSGEPKRPELPVKSIQHSSQFCCCP